MRENVRIHTPEELHQRWLQRDLYLKSLEIHEDDDAPFILIWVAIACIAWSAAFLAYWYS